MKSPGMVVVPFIVVLWLLAACAPVAAPAPQPAPQTPAPLSVAASSKPVPALNPEEAEWAKVVAAAKREGKLTVYSQHLYADIGINVRKAFIGTTGIDLDIVSSGTSSLLIERVKAERRVGTQIASVLTGAGTNMRLAQQEGLTERIGYLPELKDGAMQRYDPWLDKDNILSLFELTRSPWANTSLVRPGTEPKSWRDLLKPEWNGKMGIPDPITVPTANYTYQALTKLGRLDDAYYKELGKQQLQYQPNSRANAEVLARGEILLSLDQSFSSIKPFLEEGVPLRPIDMVEGVVTIRSGGVVLLKGAPHPNASRVFINWLSSQEGQTVFLKNYGIDGFRKDVPSFIPPQAQLRPANPIMMTLEDELEIAKIQRERVFSKLLRGN